MPYAVPDTEIAVIVADTHLDRGPASQVLARLLAIADRLHAPVFILGDMVNLWYESYRLGRRYENHFRLLRDFADRGGKAYFVPGNRDFLAGPVFTELTGLTILPELCDVKIGGTVYRLFHGDQVFLGDRNYRHYRAMVRNRLATWVLWILPDFLLEGLAALLKRDPIIPAEEDVTPLNRERFDHTIFNPAIFHYICGHIHRTIEMTIGIDTETIHINTISSWVGAPEHLIVDKSGVHMATTAEPAGHNPGVKRV